MTAFIGTSGWQYRHWRHTFYPQGVAQTKWLEFYCERFQIVELNNSFYSLPKEETFAKWSDRTPDETLSLMPADVRTVVEFRHESWWTDEVRSILEKHNAANCLADRGAKPVTEMWKTTDWTFVRFHAGLASPQPCYRKKTLEEWVERLQEQWTPQEDLYLFFNNDPRACALRDAIWFAELIQAAGWDATRVPKRSDVTVGDIDSAAWAVKSPLGAKVRTG